MAAVKVYGSWGCPFTFRVRLALKLKGIEYEYVEEDLTNKSADLLKYNPVTQQVPVVVHEGKPLIESLVILEYIEETWKGTGPNLLPEDPYERAVARFLARFADEKIIPASYTLVSKRTEQEQKKVMEDIQNNLITVGRALRGKEFFGGESIGYLDIAIGAFPLWLRALAETCGLPTEANDEKVKTGEEWAHKFVSLEVVKEALPSYEALLELTKKRAEQFLAAAA